MKSVSYKDVDIFAGIDVHKRSWDIKIMTAHSSQKQIHRAEPSVEFVARYLKRHYPGAKYHCVYEAGFSGFWIQEELAKQGINTIVVHPGDVPTTDKEKRFKNDKIDSKKLALSLRSGQLKGIYIPPKKTQKDRSLVRQRYQYASDERRIKNRIKAHLDFYGTKTADDIDDRYWSKRYIDSLNKLAQSNGDVVLCSYLEKLSTERKFVLDSTRQLRELSKEESYALTSKLLMSIPGVGLLTAMVYLTEIGQVDRFKGDDEYLAYIGLIPGCRSSGDKERTGGISNRGNKRVRTALILSAWMSIRNGPSMGIKYEEYRKRGMNANKAIVKIASKLALIMKAVLRDRKEYTEATII